MERMSLEFDGKVAVLKFNHPQVLNAIGAQMLEEIPEALADIEDKANGARCLLLTGEGRGFSAGGDLKTEAGPLGASDDPDFDMGNFGAYRELAHLFFNDLRHQVLQRAFKKIEDLPQITVAAINGPAVGIGLEICTLCDLRIASDRARLGEVAVPAGFLPESGGARNLPKLVGVGRALEMILTGRIVDAAEAERIGLVDHLVGEDTAFEEFEDLLAEYAATNSAGCRASKQMLLDCFDLGWEAFFNKYLKLQQKAVAAPDFAEAMEAYRTGRDPRWE